jgi:multicomponent Na+:H+ antiporter subunit G
MSGFNFTSLKLLCVLVFLWFSSPTSSHLIARLEVTTDEEPQKHYRVCRLDEIGSSATETAASDGGQTGKEA